MLDIFVLAWKGSWISLEVGTRLEKLAGVELMGAAMKVVRAGLDLHIDCGATSRALLGVKRISSDVDRFNGVRGRNISNVRRQPRIPILCAIKPRVVLLVGLTVNVSVDRALWVASERVSFRNHRGARNDSQQGLEIAPL